jgi:hypothetical protein
MHDARRSAVGPAVAPLKAACVVCGHPLSAMSRAALTAAGRAHAGACETARQRAAFVPEDTAWGPALFVGDGQACEICGGRFWEGFMRFRWIAPGEAVPIGRRCRPCHERASS